MVVPISDTDQLRETCAGMFGGDEAFIEGMSNPVRNSEAINGMSGRIKAVVISEWTRADTR